MKKNFKFLAGLIILASALMLCSCAFDWSQTYDTWYKYDNASGLNIPVVDKENSEAEADAKGIASGMMKNAEFYVCFNPDDGLTIAIQSTKAEEISIAGGLLTTSVDVVTGASKQYTKEQFGKVRWAALYATGAFKESSEPKVISNPEQCIILAGNKADGNANQFDFQWKKVLRQILIEQLLGEV